MVHCVLPILVLLSLVAGAVCLGAGVGYAQVPGPVWVRLMVGGIVLWILAFVILFTACSLGG